MTTVEERVTRLEGINEEIRDRLNSIEARLDSRANSLDGRMNGLDARMNTLTAITVAMWVTTNAGRPVHAGGGLAQDLACQIYDGKVSLAKGKNYADARPQP